MRTVLPILALSHQTDLSTGSISTFLFVMILLCSCFSLSCILLSIFPSFTKFSPSCCKSCCSSYSKPDTVRSNNAVQCGLFVIHVSEWQLALATWGGGRQDNPLLYKPGYNEIWEFWAIASSHCPFLPCLAHLLSSLEALPRILLTPKVACTLRHPIRTFWAKIQSLLFCLPPVKQVFCIFPEIQPCWVLKTCFLLEKWTCFALAKEETCCSLCTDSEVIDDKKKESQSSCWRKGKSISWIP